MSETYNGTVVDFKYHGTGVMENEEGRKWDGTWDNNEFVTGTEYDTDGTTAVATFTNKVRTPV